jgi:hypothetical protein
MYVASVGSKIGCAGSNEDEWPESAFAIFEVHNEVSEILVALEIEHLPVGASSNGLGQGAGPVVIPDEFEAGARTNQVANANPVVQPVLHVDTLVESSREIHTTVDFSTNKGRDFNAPLGPCHR